jgi:hypothetical protein
MYLVSLYYIGRNVLYSRHRSENPIIPLLPFLYFSIVLLPINFYKRTVDKFLFARRTIGIGWKDFGKFSIVDFIWFLSSTMVICSTFAPQDAWLPFTEFVHFFTSPYACLSACLSCLSACLPVCLPAILSVCLSVSLPVYLPFCLSACVSACLSVYLSVLRAYPTACLCLSSVCLVCLAACLTVCLK